MISNAIPKSVANVVAKLKCPLITAELKCPHGRGIYQDGSEAVTEAKSDGDGGSREDHLKGGRREDRCVLPTDQTDQAGVQREGDPSTDSWEHRSKVQPPDPGANSKADRGIIPEEICGV